jgi:hypothetical protein
MGTVQEIVETLQLIDSVLYFPSLFLIATVYAVIGEPPSLGATQVIVTLVFEFTEVVGAAGTLGIVAGSIAPLP